jgi:hypothetical protein
MFSYSNTGFEILLINLIILRQIEKLLKSFSVKFLQ